VAAYWEGIARVPAGLFFLPADLRVMQLCADRVARHHDIRAAFAALHLLRLGLSGPIGLGQVGERLDQAIDAIR